MGEIEPPECPVCLQPYDDSTAVIPRVLACGHSVCELCLSLLPHPFSVPSAVRCPACTQIVNYPHPLGAAALTKNIDLLRLSLLLLPKSERKPSAQKPTNDPVHAPRRNRFVPHIWSDELYSAWKDWILPQDSVILKNWIEEVGFCCLGRGKVVELFSKGESLHFGSSSPLVCRMKDDEEVNLLKIGHSGYHQSVLEYSYMARIMSVLSMMSGAERMELASILKLSLRSKCRVCKVYGLWFDKKSGWLYLVCERKNYRMSEIEQFCVSNGKEAVGSEASVPTEHRISQIAKIGSELCEALINLQSEGFICGCLGLSCFSLDEFGHVYLDLSEVIIMGRKLRKLISLAMISKEEADDLTAEELLAHLLPPSPEILIELIQREGINVGSSETKRLCDIRADAWSMGLIFIYLFTGNWLSEDMSKCLMSSLRARGCDLVTEYKALCMDFQKQLNDVFKASIGSMFAPFEKMLVECLDYDPGSRPPVTELWRGVKGIMNPCSNDVVQFTRSVNHEKGAHCLVLGELCSISSDIADQSAMVNMSITCNDDEASGHAGEASVVRSIPLRKTASVDIQGHRDCVTKLCIGGGMLLSSSFDKIVKVWSLQGFSHVHTFEGHQHRITAMVVVDSVVPQCISADIGGGIFVWEINTPFVSEPLKTWCEPKDWRYSGIYALSAPGNEHLYTGSGDRLIKAWSLKDYTLSCSMEGHKSVVSALAACNNVLYSGSWDGTVRLWNLHDHSSLAVLEQGLPGVVSPIHCIYVNHQTVIAAYENGIVKIWMDDEITKPLEVHDGAVLAVGMVDRWLFTGGWDKTVKVQEIIGDQFELDARQAGSITCNYVITALLCGQDHFFVGFGNGLIKAYNHAP